MHTQSLDARDQTRTPTVANQGNPGEAAEAINQTLETSVTSVARSAAR